MSLAKKGLFGIEFGLSATFFVMFLIDCVESVFLPKILLVRGCSPAEIGELKAIGYGAVVAAPILYAFLTQKIKNRRLAIQIGSWLSGIAIIALFGKWGFLGFATLMVAQNFFQQGTANQLDSLTLNTIPRTHLYGRIRIWGSIGYVVSVISGGFVADKFGFLNIIWYMVIVQAVLMFAVFCLPSDKKSKEEEEADRILKEKEKEQDAIAAKSAGRFPIKIGFILVIAFIVLKSMSMGVMQNFLVIYMTGTLHISHALSGTIMSIAPIGEMGGLILSVFLLKRFKIRTLLFITGLACALRWALQGFSGGYVAVLMASQLLHLFTFSIAHTCALKYIKENFTEKKHVGLAIAIYGSANLGLGKTLGALLAGYTWGYGYQYSFSAMIIVALIAAIVGLFIKSKSDNEIGKKATA